MDAWKFVLLAKSVVVNHVNAHPEENNVNYIDTEEVDIVWMHQKDTTSRAILTVIPPNDVLYEVVYNDEKKEATVDIYKKSAAACVKF